MGKSHFLIIGLFLLTGACLNSTIQEEPIFTQMATTYSKTSTATPIQTPSPTLTQGPTATPRWTLKDDFSRASDGIRKVKVRPNTSKESLEFLHSSCPIEISSFQVDMLVVDTGYSGGAYSAHLDLHGIGTVQSWYAQMGYHYDPSSGINAICHAYSYSSDAPRFWQKVSQRVSYGKWHTFKIEVVPTGDHWGYSFLYLLDGEQVCVYQPPLDWDGDHHYRVLWQRVEIWLDGKNATDKDIEVHIDNYYSYESPACK